METQDSKVFAMQWKSENKIRVYEFDDMSASVSFEFWLN